jgi:hypothetical protein
MLLLLLILWGLVPAVPMMMLLLLLLLLILCWMQTVNMPGIGWARSYLLLLLLSKVWILAVTRQLLLLRWRWQRLRRQLRTLQAPSTLPCCSCCLTTPMGKRASSTST